MISCFCSCNRCHVITSCVYYYGVRFCARQLAVLKSSVRYINGSKFRVVNADKKSITPLTTGVATGTSCFTLAPFRVRVPSAAQCHNEKTRADALAKILLFDHINHDLGFLLLAGLTGEPLLRPSYTDLSPVLYGLQKCVKRNFRYFY